MKIYQILFVAGLIILGGFVLKHVKNALEVKYKQNKAIVESSQMSFRESLPPQIVKSRLLGEMTVTAYRSVPEQTDSSPFITADGTHVSPYGVAISRDLFKDLKYGDIVYIEFIGFKVVNDKMNKRHKQHIDIWVETYHDEKVFHSQYKGKRVKVYLVSRLTK